jgi:putative DNA primase/helicase
MSGDFTPDPSWPTLVELATEVWGQPNQKLSGKDDIRWGHEGGRHVTPSTNTWKIFEPPGGGGGYVDMWKLARGNAPLPPRGGHKTNGAHPPLAQDKATDRVGLKPWEHVGVAYPYRDANGGLILEAVRMKPPWPGRFMQRCPNGERWNGETQWKWSVKHIVGHDCLLYRLPELLASAGSGVTVFVVEGEKDADNLAALGLIATTNIGGAGKWRADYAQYFAGRHVVVLPDNDEAGEAQAHDVATSLHGVAASLRVYRLPGLLPKGDVSDWLADGGTRDELLWQAREAPLWEPPAMPPPVEPPGGAGGPPEPPDPPDDDEQPPEEWDDIPAPILEPGTLITEQEAMRLFINIHHEQLRFNHSNGGWLIWRDNFWRPDERKLAFSWALDLCRELSKAVVARDPTRAQATIQKIRFSGAVEQGARAMPQVATTQTDWDADPMLLGTPGGIVDLKTGILRPGTHADMISRTTSVTPSIIPECPTWLAFLDYAMHGDDQLIRFIQRYFGYCLTGVVIEEVFLFMFGPGGAGKGTMVETIASIVGDYASTVPMEVFTGQSWSPTEYYRANMAGQRLIVANEPERGARWAEAFIKETTGGDMLSGRHPMGRPFRFKPSHKMAMQGNHMPKLRGKSTGMERRLRILPVTRKPVTPDIHLKAKLIAEGPGILRWLIEGCLAWQKIGLNPPDAVLTAGSKYFEAQDVFTRWIEERCDLHDGFATETGKLRADFNQWAKANGEDEMNGNDFAEAIDQHEPPFKRKKGHAGKRLVWGIGLKPPEPNDNWRDR